jgi:hypothetical protein
VEKVDADTAIYVLSRVAGEGADRFNAPGDYLLTEEEHAMLADICKNHRDVIVLINAGGVAHSDDGPKLLPAARAIAIAVNLSQPPGQSPIVFSEIAPVSEPRPGTISTSVIFTVSNSTL